jgi:hypothetical protein
MHHSKRWKKLEVRKDANVHTDVRQAKNSVLAHYRTDTMDIMTVKRRFTHTVHLFTTMDHETEETDYHQKYMDNNNK